MFGYTQLKKTEVIKYTNININRQYTTLGASRFLKNTSGCRL